MIEVLATKCLISLKVFLVITCSEMSIFVTVSSCDSSKYSDISQSMQIH